MVYKELLLNISEIEGTSMCGSPCSGVCCGNGCIFH